MEIWCHCYDDEGTICDVPAPFSLGSNHLRHPPGGILLPQSQALMQIHTHGKCLCGVCECVGIHRSCGRDWKANSINKSHYLITL